MLQRLRKFIPKEKKSLQTRFQVGLAVILFLYCLTAVIAIYTLQRNMLEREALRQTEVVMDSFKATRSYVRETLRPRMFDILPDNRFIIEAMSSSYISRVIMENLKEDLPEFGYRRVALNSRNPDFSPNPQERKMIEYFRQAPEARSWSGMVRQEGKQRFIRFQPVVFRSSCMRCHGQPKDAPAGVIKRYGNNRGFNHTPDEVGGIVSVSIPMESDLAGIRSSVFWILLGILASSFVLYIFIRLFFQQLVVSNLQSLLGVFRESVSDAGETYFYQKIASKDELSELYEGTRLLARHLEESRNQLKLHASKLEDLVHLRTEALEKSHDQLSRQVRRRNQELHLFTSISELTSGSESLNAILNKVLIKARAVLPGEDVAIYLRTESGLLELCCCQSGVEMPELFPLEALSANSHSSITAQDAPACNTITIIDDHESGVAIPLCCRNRDLGVMLITGINRDSLTEPVRDLLLSIGNQIGIAVESIQNMSAIRNSERLLQSVFNGISDSLVLLDTDGRLKMVNEAFLDRHQLTREETLGKRLSDVVKKENCLIDLESDQFDTAFASPQSRIVTTEEGSSFDVLFYPVAEQEGTVSSIICLARDVTESRQVEQKMRQTEKLAAIGQLAAGVAHEINNPLSIILCHTDIVKNDYSLTEDLFEDIDTIERHALNCRTTVTDLLNFARTTDSTENKQIESLNNAITSAVAMVEVQFAKQRIEIRLDLDPSDPRCLIDSSRLQQVLINLLMNSAQAIEQDGTILLNSKKTATGVEIGIEDDGPGIPADIQDAIFDPFFTTKVKDQGTGLGLSVSFGIVAEHDGDITMHSKPGKTVFTIFLPHHRDDT